LRVDRRAHDLPHVQARTRGDIRAEADGDACAHQLIEFHQAAPEEKI
jgi:hypothetical protein